MGRQRPPCCTIVGCCLETFMADAAYERLNRFRTVPNLLTFSRICLAPLLVAAILDNHYALGFGLFVVAGLTDLLDGLLARLLKQYTMLGQYLDPVADKLLLSTLFLVLTYKELIPARVTAMVIRSEEHTSELQSLRHLVCR